MITRRFSPQVMYELLRETGSQVINLLKTLDPFSVGSPVSWAGPDRAPRWLDIAREYSEKWHHQQQIRDAVSMPGLKEPKYMKPILETFVRGLPNTYRKVDAAEGTHVRLTIRGASGGRWSVVRQDRVWTLLVENESEPDAEIFIDEEDAWKLFSKTFSKEMVFDRVTVVGEKLLGLKVLDMVSVIG